MGGLVLPLVVWALPFLYAVLRYLYIVFRQPSSLVPGRRVRTMIVLGSGGHSAEMLQLLSNLDLKAYCPRCYVIAATDKLGAGKVASFESRILSQPSDYAVEVIPRSREVGQSYLTSVLTTLYSTCSAASIVWRGRPQLILVNGPGTCIPICVAAFVYRLFHILDLRIVYVESIARTQKLSLSGKILYSSYMADIFFVQWEQLAKKLPRARYRGRLY